MVSSRKRHWTAGGQLLHAGLIASCVCLLPFANRAAVNVLTWHNDNAHTGQNLQETILTLTNVNSNSFGQLFSYAVDGFVYAQPLYMSQVSVPGKGVRNLVFVATEHDSVFAFDADDPQRDNKGPLWTASFVDATQGISSVPLTDLGFEGAELPELGITGTPVIDPDTGTLYVVAQTRQVDSTGTVTHPQWLHALDVATGAEKFGGPTRIRAVVPGTGHGDNGSGQLAFDELYDFQRPGLVLANGVVYAGYASVGDVGPYHGWVLGFDAHTLQLVQLFNSTPNGSDGGIWMSGASPSADTQGQIYCMTGNGDFDPTASNYGDSFLKLSPSGTNLVVADYFTPYDEAALNGSDGDLGSGSPMLLPDSVGSSAHPHLLIGCDKEGTIYLIDRDKMGHFNAAGDTQIVRSLPQVIHGTWGNPAFFNGWIYFQGMTDTLKAFSISNAVLSVAPVSENPNSVWSYPGGTPSVSANGTNNAIVWLLQTDTFSQGAPAILHAYNATNLAVELYNSTQAGTRDQPGLAQKFAVPVIADGKVFVQGGSRLTVYGLLGAPQIAAQPASTGLTPDSTATLTVSASGPAPISYQWLLDGTAIDGATNATLVLTNLTLGIAGPYSVQVSNAFGNVTSSEANVFVSDPPSLSIDSDQQLVLTGTSGLTYEIQTLDLLSGTRSWQPLVQVTLPGDSTAAESAQASINDPAPAPSQRFYRAQLAIPSE